MIFRCCYAGSQLHNTSMTNPSPWQDFIPDPVLLHIFSFLEAKSLLRASCTCHRWYRIARDESLWKILTQTNWDTKGGRKDSDQTWYQEYKRLFYHAPTQFSERIEGHSDEVLDVAFSHDGRLFCTTSKDTKVKIWEVGNPTQLKHTADLGLALDWNMTQYATFNSNDTYLLVCGVKFQLPAAGSQSQGLGVVFRMKDFRLVQEMPMDPPHLFADWYNDNICVGGYVPTAANNDFFCVKAFKVIDDVPERIPLRCPYEEGSVIYSFFGDHHRTMNLLVANVPHKPEKSTVLRSQHKNSGQDTPQSSEIESDLLKTFSEDFHINPTIAPRDHTRDFLNSSKRDANANNSNILHQANSKSKSSKDACDRCGKMSSAASALPSFDKYMIFVTGEQHNAIAFHRVEDLPETLEKKLKDKKLFEETVRKATEENGGQGNITATQLTTPVNPTKSIHLPGHYISGMKLSRDHRYLYFNCRYAIYDVELGFPKLMEDMEVKTIDLQTFRLVPELVFGGHKGFSEFPAWYICLDSCDDYVASGSEQFLGYLWDRRYRTCLAKLQHCEGVVNGVAFNPVDPECLVTVADDRIINIWRARNRKKQLEEHT
ncbi:F-box/WD repeat-containing protein 5-like isoform X1 [Pecten maximus]|uniref:F-box/WD repeat-containing protein 5-like isoform X1 n=1 Tax=Pecten maximus TaxID=6579 RepID=UPI0014588332|nr:F-box/WD repeat-containing protein 5-like isoform X1 [Pecten maximus]XP_033749945.1 F-box/WD repeat-containing protein 5-like isoform X1 [Pecten maximus]XP_033749946.1 F-box/WD repeat-containing protein 5-like isoform X2 [Pecten maximus]XP_033749947.1 F-box/WD repeat-containing protein 5-like isoform X1 [Pecten maximus]